MFGSSMRNISFQDLFARPRPDLDTIVATTATASAVRGTTTTATASYHQDRHHHQLQQSTTADTNGARARTSMSVYGNMSAPEHLELPPSGGDKTSLGYILDGLHTKAHQPQYVDAKQWILPPPPPPPTSRSLQQQFVHIKREPVTLFAANDCTLLFSASSHGAYQTTPELAPSAISGSRSNSDDGNDSSESHERDVYVARDAMQLPPIASHINTSPLEHRHHLQQQQYQQRFGLVAAASRSPADASSGKRKKKRKARICKEPECDKYVVDHGLCIRHGGGKRCNIDGCNCRAQNRGLCWKHGGYTICKVEDCTKRAKSRGICWSHGGGTRCKSEGCSKIAVSLGRCWAHGGGKRCTIESCKKPASERTNNLCADHFGWLQPTHEQVQAQEQSQEHEQDQEHVQTTAQQSSGP